MSIYLTFSEAPGDQLASNTGWSDFTDWVDELPADRFERLSQLVDYGYTVNVKLLNGELLDALHMSTPGPSAASVAERLRELLLANEDEEAAFVTDGMGPDNVGSADS